MFPWCSGPGFVVYIAHGNRFLTAAPWLGWLFRRDGKMGVAEQMGFDNHDQRIRYYGLVLERGLDRLPQYSLPEGYSFVFYRPGDRDAWIGIEKSAKEFSSYRQGLEAWGRYYGPRESELPGRMVFIENAEGEKVATATAFYDIWGHSGPDTGWLHWVAVRRAYQGQGLSKPLVSYVLGLMQGLGYTRAVVPTQTTTWLACKVYLDLGFLPDARNAVESRDGWRIVKALTWHPALQAFDAAPLEEIISSRNSEP